MATKMQAWADRLVEQVLEGEVSLNDAIEQMDKRLEIYDYVKQKRDRLLSARRSLLGVGSRTTSSGGNSLTQDEVAKKLSEYSSGATVSELAEELSSTEGSVRGHLNRGATERFLKRSDGKWFLRDPENGINTTADLEEDDD